MQPGVAAMVLNVIEFLGQRLLECDTPENIRLDEKSITIMLMIVSVLDPAMLRENCPSFCEIFLAVMLREVEDSQFNGTTDQTRDLGRSEEAAG